MFKRVMRRLKNKFVKRTPQQAQNFWATQHLRKTGWVESHWQQNNRREFLAKTILQLDDNLESVFECGSNVGANLRAIHALDPTISLHGIDINESAVNYGKEQFAAEGIFCDLQQCSIYDLSEYEDNSFDVVFTSVVLLHIPDESIGSVISELYRIAKKSLVFLELNVEYPWDEAYFEKVHLSYGDRWAKNYRRLVQENTNTEDVLVLSLPFGFSDGISHQNEKVDCNAVVIAQKDNKRCRIKRV